MPDQTDSSVEDLRAKIDELNAELETLREFAREKGHDAFENVKHHAEEEFDHLKHAAETYGKEAGAYIRTHPNAAVGIAAFVGFLAGMLMSSRR